MQTALFWFGILMAAVFICCGFAFLLSDFLVSNVPKPNRTWLGIIFLLYGSFRGTRQYMQYKKMRRDEGSSV